jgi:hypothetical protein
MSHTEYRLLGTRLERLSRCCSNRNEGVDVHKTITALASAARSRASDPSPSEVSTTAPVSSLSAVQERRLKLSDPIVNQVSSTMQTFAWM